MNDHSPAWLETLRRDLTEITQAAAEEYWPTLDGTPFFNYRLEHVRQVERDALALLDEVGGDGDVVLASVWIHDRGQPMFVGDNHWNIAVDWADAHLAETGFPADKVDAVCRAVAMHSKSATPVGGIPEDLHEARLLWDADKVAHVGPVELITRILNCVAADSLPADGSAPQVAAAVAKALAPLAAWSFSPDGFYFDVSRRWAAERHGAQTAFAETLCRQISR